MIGAPWGQGSRCPNADRASRVTGAATGRKGGERKVNGRRRLIPWWGYLVINAVALLFLVLVYQVGEAYAGSYRAHTAGILPVLATCYVAFVIVSCFDAIYDRLDVRRKHRKSTRRPAGSETNKDGESRSD
ncbi:MAG: hypothetical protein JJU11_02435 [Candidatus Sumerlaeia bacterium]|nr:hypothetical protein [Candidatus Sumerlaeia bacterium]